MNIKKLIKEEFDSLINENNNNNIVICVGFEPKNENKINFMNDYIDFIYKNMSKNDKGNIVSIVSENGPMTKYRDWFIDKIFNNIDDRYVEYENGRLLPIEKKIFSALHVISENRLFPKSTPQQIKQSEKIIIEFINFIIDNELVFDGVINDKHINQFIESKNYNTSDVQLLKYNKEYIPNIIEYFKDLENYLLDEFVYLTGNKSSGSLYEIEIILKYLNVQYKIIESLTF